MPRSAKALDIASNSTVSICSHLIFAFTKQKNSDGKKKRKFVASNNKRVKFQKNRDISFALLTKLAAI